MSRGGGDKGGRGEGCGGLGRERGVWKLGREGERNVVGESEGGSGG